MTLHVAEVADKKEWEDVLLSNAPQSLFQSWAWGEVQKKSGNTVQRLGFLDGKRLVGIAQMTVVRARRGPFLHIRHGPIWSVQSNAYWQDFVRFVRDTAKKEGEWFVRVSPLLENTAANREFLFGLGFVPSPIHEVDAERCWVLDIDKTEDEILAGMRKSTRYEIRQAQKAGVVVRQSQEVKDLDHFFALYEATRQRHHFVGHSAIREEFEVFVKEDRALIFLASYNKEITSAAIILFYGGQAIYHHGASLQTKIPVSHLVQWEAIREAKKRGMKLYNFYGIAPDDKPNHPWRGITVFKKGFGGREVNYLHAHDVPVSPLYLIPRSIETIRRKMKGY